MVRKESSQTKMVNDVVAVPQLLTSFPIKISPKNLHTPIRERALDNNNKNQTRWKSHFHTDEVGSEHTPCADMVVRIHRVKNNK